MREMFDKLRDNARVVVLLLLAGAFIAALLLYRLGSLTGGLSAGEQQVAAAPLGWHGLYHNPFYLPLEFTRSIVFFIFKHHGQTLTRIANVLFGGVAIVAFGLLVKLWHNARIAVLATILFGTSAWVLHVSRLASYDVLYICALPVLLLTYMAMLRDFEHAVIFYGSALIWGLCLYVPGLIWLVLLEIFWLRGEIADGWRYFNRRLERVLYCLSYLIWLPLLADRLRNLSVLRTWLGLPSHFAAPLTLLKQFVAVPVHLLVRGPQYPQLWLGRTPLLDVFTLTMCLLGIYFYLTHLSTARIRLLVSMGIVGWILVGLGGPVGLSLLVPLAYLAAATGLAYLLHRWLRVFPLNPLARSIGLGLIVLAVVVSSIYNLRAYFVAWPHNAATQAIFRYHR